MSRNSNNRTIDIRLTLDQNCEDDQKIFHKFQKINKYLGIKKNTEVLRYCIKMAFDNLKYEGAIN